MFGSNATLMRVVGATSAAPTESLPRLLRRRYQGKLLSRVLQEDPAAADQPLSAILRCQQRVELPLADLKRTCANQAAQEAILVKGSSSAIPAEG